MGIAYRPEIDGLRAIAVLAVVAYHAGLGGAGFVGVDVFFVISGYLITALLIREWQERGSIDLLAFYARRVRRIFPAAAAVVLAVLGVAALVLPLAQQAHTSLSAGAALVFGANVFFQLTSGGYFDGAAEEMPLLHLWSLSVEEQFYFLWPALLIVVLRWRPTWLLPILGGLGLASFALAEFWIGRGSDAAFYQMPARFWELAAGGMIALSPARSLPRWAAPAGVLLTLAACAFTLGGHFPGAGAMPAVAGAALLIAAVHGGASNALLASRPMVGIGLISYSLYLWHWPLLAFYRATVIGEGDVQTRLILCAIAFPLAFASYRYIEQPFRKMRFRSGRTVVVGASLSAMLALSACMVGLREPPLPADDPFPLATAAERAATRSPCHAEYFDKVVPKCPDPEGAVTAIWGDSMGLAWLPAMEKPYIEYTMSGCSPLVGYLPEKPFPADHNCLAFNDKVLARARGLDRLVIVGRWTMKNVALVADTLEVAPHVGSVVIVGPTPEMREPVPKCIRSGNPDACAIPRAEFDAHAGPILAVLREAAAKHPNVTVLDMTDRFCTATTCPPVLDGVPLYWDTHHVSATAASGIQLR